jgi:hypothetical protein
MVETVASPEVQSRIHNALNPDDTTEIRKKTLEAVDEILSGPKPPNFFSKNKGFILAGVPVASGLAGIYASMKSSAAANTADQAMKAVTRASIPAFAGITLASLLGAGYLGKQIFMDKQADGEWDEATKGSGGSGGLDHLRYNMHEIRTIKKTGSMNKIAGIPWALLK